MYNYEANNIQGWMSPAELVWLYSIAKMMESIAEVGSWRGRSTHALLEGCKGVVHAIDHWQGSYDEINTCHKDAKTQDIFSQFKGNVGHYPNLVIHNIDHKIAANEFEDNSIDMVFIDGCHTKEAAQHDILSWLPKVKYLLCGHDYDQAHIPAIARDTELDFFKIDVGSLWILRR